MYHFLCYGSFPTSPRCFFHGIFSIPTAVCTLELRWIPRWAWRWWELSTHTSSKCGSLDLREQQKQKGLCDLLLPFSPEASHKRIFWLSTEAGLDSHLRVHSLYLYLRGHRGTNNNLNEQALLSSPQFITIR